MKLICIKTKNKNKIIVKKYIRGEAHKALQSDSTRTIEFSDLHHKVILVTQSMKIVEKSKHIGIITYKTYMTKLHKK